MRLSLPVFISPEVKSKQLLRWHVAQTPSGTLKVSLINDGNVHIKINNLQLQLPSKVQSWVNQEPFQYVLPGQSRDWIMSTNSNYPPLPLGTALKLVAQTNTGKIKADVMTAP
jgi:fimbrial chaperone protein